jgi:hypothetical protein
MNTSERMKFPPGVRSQRDASSVEKSKVNAGAFTLIEVMIATGIFFMAVFTILAVVSTGLRNARALQQTKLDAGPLASELMLTNQVTEGFDSGDFDMFYPGMYQDYSWTSDTYEVATNGLYRVDFVVERRVDGEVVERPMSLLIYSPQSASSSVESIFRRPR